MKKIFSLMFVAVAVLAVASCGGNAPKNATAESVTEQTCDKAESCSKAAEGCANTEGTCCGKEECKKEGGECCKAKETTGEAVTEAAEKVVNAVGEAADKVIDKITK